MAVGHRILRRHPENAYSTSTQQWLNRTHRAYTRAKTFVMFEQEISISTEIIVIRGSAESNMDDEQMNAYKCG